MKFGKNDFLKFLQEKDGKELLRLLRGLGGEWVVQSSPFGCPEGFSKISLRRRKNGSGGITCSYCFTNQETEKIKGQIRQLLKRRVMT